MSSTSLPIPARTHYAGLHTLFCCERELTKTIHLRFDRRKRPTKTDQAPTQAAIQIWQPLLAHLTTESHPELTTLLANRIVDILLDSDSEVPTSSSAPPATQTEVFSARGTAASDPLSDQERKKERDSARWALGCWLVYLWTAEDEILGIAQTEKREIWAKLLKSMLSKQDDSM